MQERLNEPSDASEPPSIGTPQRSHLVLGASLALGGAAGNIVQEAAIWSLVLCCGVAIVLAQLHRIGRGGPLVHVPTFRSEEPQ